MFTLFDISFGHPNAPHNIHTQRHSKYEQEGSFEHLNNSSCSSRDSLIRHHCSFHFGVCLWHIWGFDSIICKTFWNFLHASQWNKYYALKSCTGSYHFVCWRRWWWCFYWFVLTSRKNTRNRMDEEQINWEHCTQFLVLCISIVWADRLNAQNVKLGHINNRKERG